MELTSYIALIIQAKQPYVDWANSFDDGGPRYHPEQHQPSVYLIDDPKDAGDTNKGLRSHWHAIFEEELSAWIRDHDTWPSPRNLKMFKKWFNVQGSELVFDLTAPALDEPAAPTPC